MALQFYECGCCGHYHLSAWHGDCRDDNNRFTYEQMEKKSYDETGQPPDYITLEEQMENEG